MAGEILLNPDSRLLGPGAVQDFSLYGAQPEPSVSFAPASADASVDPIGSTPVSPSSTAGGGAAPEAGAPVAEAPADNGGLAPSTSTTSLTRAAPTAFAAPPMSTQPAADSAPSIPQSQTGSLTSSPIRAENPVETPSSVSESGLPGGSSLSPETLEAVPQPGALQAPVLNVADPVIGTVASVADAGLAAIGSVPEVAEDAVSDLLGVAEATLGSLVSEAPLADVGELLPTGDPLAILSPAHDENDDALDLLGSDPAGGIATLVTLVTAADMFDLRDAGPDQVAAEPVAPSDLLDVLITEPGDGSLLGDSDDDATPLLDSNDAGTNDGDLPFGLGL